MLPQGNFEFLGYILLLLLLSLWSDRPRWPLDQHKCSSVKWEHKMYDAEKHCM